MIGALAISIVGISVGAWMLPWATSAHLPAYFLFFGILVFGIHRMGEWLSRLGEVHLLERDRKMSGEIPEHALYVGIAYADGFWSLESSYSWDRGWLSISPNGLTFSGCASTFSLPSHAVTATRLARSSTESSSKLRLFIDWLAPDGEANTLSLEPLAVGAHQTKTEAAESLLLELQSTFSQPVEHPLAPAWPPAVNQERLRSNVLRFGNWDVIWLFTRSLFSAAVACAVLYLALTAFSVAPGFRRMLVTNAFNFIFCGSLFLTCFSRYRRWQTTPPPPIETLPDHQDR